jgi:hypothetical protein
MKKGLGNSRSRERGTVRQVNRVDEQRRELLSAVCSARGSGVLTAQERRVLMELIDALADLLGEAPEKL